MAADQLTIWCNAKLPPEAQARLREGLASHRLVMAEKVVNNIEPSQPDAMLPEADVAFGQPDTRQIIESSRLKWIQLSSAGYARYDRDDVREALKRRGAVLSNASTVYAEACAQHALAFILASARQLPAALENQRGPKSWPAAAIRRESSLVGQQKILIVGFGAIGRRLAELLTPFRAQVYGFRRKVRGDESVAVFAIADIEPFLSLATIVINILPAGAGTDRFFSSELFGKINHGAVFINIGRGATVDQDALRESLASGRLRSAFLDVTDPEPLPPDHPLWTTPNCFITPHTAGGVHDEFYLVVHHFLENLKRFTNGQSLNDRVF